MSTPSDQQRDESGVESVNPSPTRVITLDVAGRLFKVSIDVLTSESAVFRNQLSDRFTWTPQPDGTYFLEADPEIFEHLLRFMRRPASFPLFWSKERGYDYDLYRRLSDEAEYFQVDALHQWIKELKYLKAIRIYREISIIEGVENMLPELMSDGNVSESRHIATKTRQVYVCPRGKLLHRGDPDRCGRLCRNARGDADDKYEQEAYVEMTTVTERVVYNPMPVN